MRNPDILQLLNECLYIRCKVEVYYRNLFHLAEATNSETCRKIIAEIHLKTLQTVALLKEELHRATLNRLEVNSLAGYLIANWTSHKEQVTAVTWLANRA